MSLPPYDPLKQPFVDIEWLGCVGDNTSVDNGPLLAAALARFGPEIKGIPFVPAKTFWCSTTFDTGKGVGPEMWGVAAPDQARADGAWTNLQPVSRFAWNGADGGLLCRIRRSSFGLRHIGIACSRQKDNVFEPSTTTGIEITQQGADWPVGNINLDVTITNGGRGVYCAPGSHADHINARIMTHGVKVPYEINENQSVAHHVHLILKGSGDTAINIRDGGRFQALVETVGNWNNILALGDEEQDTGPTSNQGRYCVDLWTDGGDVIDTLVRERTSNHPCHVSFRYWEASGATINNKKVQLCPNSDIVFERWPR